MRKASLLLAVLALLCAPLLAGSSITPPFNQCPAAGADTSCGFLVVFTNTGIQVYTDSSQPPYDSDPGTFDGDDTLVGALNNSSSTVNSVTLSGYGNGGGAFAFDGDGVCTYISVSGCGSWWNNTDDWGPGVTFSNLTSSGPNWWQYYDTGTVNFTGGLLPGQSRFFSLESAFSGESFPVPTPGTPEPATLCLLGTGLVTIGSRLRRRR